MTIGVKLNLPVFGATLVNSLGFVVAIVMALLSGQLLAAAGARWLSKNDWSAAPVAFAAKDTDVRRNLAIRIVGLARPPCPSGLFPTTIRPISQDDDAGYKRYGEAELAAMRNLVAAIIRFEHPANDRALLGLIALLNDWLDGRPEIRRTFAIWIRAVLLRRSKHTLVLPKIRDLTELNMTLGACRI